MNAGVGILNVGLVTSVGLSAEATCAAIRAKVSNPTPTRFRDGQGAWLLAHQVELGGSWRGTTKLVKMVSMAIAECLFRSVRDRAAKVPLLLCLAEHDRPGRLLDIDDAVIDEIERELGLQFDRVRSRVVAAGRVSAFVALAEARRLVEQEDVSQVIVAATDSLLVAGSLAALCEQGRVLGEQNSNGFIPGEGAGAILVGRPSGAAAAVYCLGFGEGMERATIDRDEPLRADGLTDTISAALKDAGSLEIHNISLRISDLSGEQYGFKEAALSIGRLLRIRRENQDLWHPAEVVGEIGSAIGPVQLAVALAAFRKGYLADSLVLLHAGADSGRRAAWILGSKLQ